ncbi:AraC family transcriptional regulator [Victivallis vadensis]|uniref:helix-turn-helix transcriptional regulator n=1 Tax=Victivallis vadensis TaxID=172901 RepID=UPI00266CE488|nr:AraC family transcriptional regulator [Victivallis vadensis]
MREKFIIPYRGMSGGPFHIQAAGISYCDGSYRIQRENSQFFVLEAIESGRGTLRVGNQTFHPQSGDGYLISAHTSHCYYSDSRDPWIKYWFNVDGAAFESLVRGFELSEAVYFPQCHLAPFFAAAMREIAEAPPESAVELAVGLVTRIVRKFYLAHHRNGGDTISPTGRQLKEFLDQHICGETPKLEELCRLCELSEAQLLRVFKRDFGQSPLAYLLQAKIHLACQFLSSSNITVKELAGMLHFTDPFYFSRVFKRKTGCSPRDYHRKTFGRQEVLPGNLSK